MKCSRVPSACGVLCSTERLVGFFVWFSLVSLSSRVCFSLQWLLKEIILCFVMCFVACSHSWGDQLVPVIKLVQARLTSRVEREKKKTTIEEKLDPAAHLDPGPKGYNVYGVVGHSLFTVPAKYLEEDLTQGRGMVNEQKRRSGGAVDCRAKCQKDLVHSRTFFQRYIAGIKRPHLVKGECNLLDILEGSVCVKKVGVSALSRAQLGSIMELYDKIVPELESCGLHELHCQAINELGDMYILSGNIR